MNLSFYTAAVGAGGQQARIDVIGNNVANVNTTGYCSKRGVFSDLIYNNLNGPEGADTRLKSGTGIKLEKTDAKFTQSSFGYTGAHQNYAITGPGFFAVQNQETNQITYTRDGSFSLSELNGNMYLATSEGQLVLDPNNNPIIVTDPEAKQNVAIFDFPVKNGMQAMGKNCFLPGPKNGQPFLATESILDNQYLERSNVELADELTKMIESQRAYQYSLKMLQTSDEVEGIINSLR